MYELVVGGGYTWLNLKMESVLCHTILCDTTLSFVCVHVQSRKDTKFKLYFGKFMTAIARTGTTATLQCSRCSSGCHFSFFGR